MKEDQSYPKYSDAWFANLYFEYGSAERVINHFWQQGESLPISIAAYHRLINKLGIIKSVGRKETKFSEALFFFGHKALEPAAPLAKIYRDYMPLQYDTSLVSLHRIYNRVVGGHISKQAVALLISREGQEGFMIANEKTTIFRQVKFAGDTTIPMNYCKSEEKWETSILRLLQQEVLTSYAVEGNLGAKSKLAHELLANCEFSKYFEILDVRVGVYKLVLPSNMLLNYSSAKLTDHRFVNAQMLLTKGIKFRWGVDEIINQKSTSSLNFLLSEVS